MGLLKKLYKNNYTSEIDDFLRNYDNKNPEFCQARLDEINKHEAIFAKRDSITEEKPNFIWEKF